MKSALALSLLTLVAATPVSPRGADGKSCSAPDPVKKCEKSLSGLQWTVHGFDYHASYIFTNPAHQNSWGYVNFNISNSIVPYTASCSAASSQLSDFFYGTQEYACTLVGSGAPAGAAVKFKYSRPSGQLDIIESVVCQGKPQDKTFVVSGSKTLTLACTDVTTTNPNWTPGQIYSDREVKCAPVDATFGASSVV
ncbi:hypothetical protein QBC42DRAFT_223996 [Cladorrhinum samala]|uniref:AA1-like domain-containing protein n=1 Tax=Cladorrhinum samala TaxID=585594 RepID=A0AAV9HQ51_9PEZI|nr:hypothetical protein QBC42DRAFT_223996 [Cladorrhinum samala]